MSENQTDRRHFHRIIMHRPVYLDCPSGNQVADLLDISLKGALIHIRDTWEPQIGNEADVRINLGDEGEDFLIRMHVRVAHVLDQQVGLEMISMDLDSATTLRRLVELNLADPVLLERELEQLTTQ